LPSVYYEIKRVKVDCPEIVSAKPLPETTAFVRITELCWLQGKIAGEVRAEDYEWHFQWSFKQGKLSIQPTLGRALIIEPLGRFLEQSDYQLEPGGDYAFTIRAKF
jgi:hypothetical protein